VRKANETTEKEGETGNRRREAKEGGKGREGKRRKGVTQGEV